MQMYFLECDKNVMEMCLLCTFFLAPPGKLCLARQWRFDTASLTSPIVWFVRLNTSLGIPGMLQLFWESSWGIPGNAPTLELKHPQAFWKVGAFANARVGAFVNAPTFLGEPPS